MPPKSKKDSESAGGAPPSSRRSSRIAGNGTANPSDQNEASKKRSGEEALPKSASTKKAKTETSTSKPKAGTVEVEIPTKSKRGKETVEEESESKEAEKKAEAPASAKPSTGGSKVLAKGDSLPSIELVDEEGEKVDVASLAGEKGVVLFLYPKADTPGCTNQACGFRDHFSEIQKLGYEVYGLSKDKSAAQKRWKEKKNLSYSLLCDPESKLIKRLGAFVAPNNTKRSHFIFEKGSGGLVDIAIGVKPAEDPKKCLEFIKQHHA